MGNRVTITFLKLSNSRWFEQLCEQAHYLGEKESHGRRSLGLAIQPPENLRKAQVQVAPQVIFIH